MPGIGIGLGVGFGGGAGAWNEADIARIVSRQGLDDAGARAAVGAATSLAAGLRAVGLLPTAPKPASAPAPAVTPLPAGLAAHWDATALALANGAAVTSWTDSVGGALAAQTGDTVAPMTFVADSGGGVPAVRASGAAVLATSGSTSADAAMGATDRTLIVVARAIAGAGARQVLPCLASSANHVLLQATPATTGRQGAIFACADAGVRTIANVSLGGVAAADYLGINGGVVTCLYNGAASGFIGIGGYQNVAAQCCGRADILAVLVWPRALSCAELMQVQRHYCDRVGQAYPGGAGARTVVCMGDSQTNGVGTAFVTDSYPSRMAAGLGLPFGTWHNVAQPGVDWPTLQARQLPLIGNISGVTGARSIVCLFEWANTADRLAAARAGARAVIDALHGQDPLRDIVFGTSLDAGTAAQVPTRANRTDYDTYWDVAANRGGIAVYRPLHLDPNIGVIGCCPTDGSANTYWQADNLHPTAAGHALLDEGPYGFREAVAARLAA